MVAFIDARLKLLFADAAQAGPDDALLIEGDGVPQPGRDFFAPDLRAAEQDHAVGCACCAPRNSAGVALSRLLLARARGTGLFFRRVLAVTHTEAGRAAVRRAAAEDPLASACFVLGESAAGTIQPPGPDGLSHGDRGS